MLARVVKVFKRGPQDEHARVRSPSSDYIDAELDEETAAGVTSHLEWCPPSQSFVNTLRATVALLGSSQVTEPPTLFGGRMRARLKKEQQGQA